MSLEEKLQKEMQKTISVSQTPDAKYDAPVQEETPVEIVDKETGELRAVGFISNMPAVDIGRLDFDKLKNAKKTANLNPKYWEAEKGKPLTAFYVNRTETTFDPENPPRDTVLLATIEDGVKQLYCHSGVQLVRQFDNVPFGAIVVVELVDEKKNQSGKGTTKIYEVSLAE